MEMDEISEYLFKILVVGDVGTGKTSIIKRYVHGIFSAHYKSTIGVDFALKILEREDCIARLQLWDIAGQERFGNMTRIYYKEAVGAFVVFDITRTNTLENVSKWKDDIDSKIKSQNGKNIPVILLANKCDLNHDESMNLNELEKFAKDAGFIGYLLTSAKNDAGINEAGDLLVDKILELQENKKCIDTHNKNNVILKNKYNERTTNIMGCCT